MGNSVITCDDLIRDGACFDGVYEAAARIKAAAAEPVDKLLRLIPSEAERILFAAELDGDGNGGYGYDGFGGDDGYGNGDGGYGNGGYGYGNGDYGGYGGDGYGYGFGGDGYGDGGDGFGGYGYDGYGDGYGYGDGDGGYSD
jgi:hypothetical protein